MTIYRRNPKTSIFYFLFSIFLLFSIFYFLFSVPVAHAAVPVWVVGFDIDTDFAAFLYYLYLHERASQLADIEQAREDVNKLIYEAFVELRDQPLLLEFHRLEKECEALPPDFPTPGGGTTDLCAFVQNVEQALKTRGIIIEEEPITFPGTGLSGNLCLDGVKTSEGCLVIKKEARVIRNPDDFIFEEPVQKARDFVMCYLAPWKHFPLSSEGQEKSDEIRDALKAHMLFKISRKQKWLQTAPPESWYTEARCELITARLGCPDFKAEQAVLELSKTSPSSPLFTINTNQACQFAKVDRFPTLEKALGVDWEYQDLFEAATNPNNTLKNLQKIVEETVDKIISQAQELRKAEFVAGQGIRGEKYQLGFQDEGDGSYYYLETEDVISPAVILLQKLQAATQAQFDIAAKAFKQPESADRAVPKKTINPPTEPPFTLYEPTPEAAQGLVPPWEDPLIQLPPRYKEFEDHQGQVSSIDLIPENYFNEYYRDILEMHKNTFGNTIKRWFVKEEGGKPICPDDLDCEIPRSTF
jgi:hypothetical protein